MDAHITEIYWAVLESIVIAIDSATATGKSKVAPTVIREALRAGITHNANLLVLSTTMIVVVAMQRHAAVPSDMRDA